MVDNADEMFDTGGRARRVLPMTVHVDQGDTTKLEINIDTGIR